MEPNAPSLTSFIDAVNSSQPLAFTADGKWYQRNRIDALFRRYIGWEKDDELSVARYFSEFLKTYELSSHSIKTLSSDGVTEEQLKTATSAIRNRLQRYVEKEQNCIHRCEAFKEKLLVKKQQQLNVFNAYQNSIEAQKAFTDVNDTIKIVDRAITTAKKEALATYHITHIERSLLAMKWRKTSQEEIYQKPSEELQENTIWLEAELLKWKDKQYPKYPTTEQGITDFDRLKIVRTCYYPQIVSLLKQDSLFFNEYCKFVFYNTRKNWVESVDVAAQFPGVQHEFSVTSKSHIEKWDKQVNNAALTFSSENTAEGIKKDILLKIEDRYYSYLKRNEIIPFTDSTTMTMDGIIQSFVEKNNRDMGPLALTQMGITHCTPKMLMWTFHEMIGTPNFLSLQCFLSMKSKKNTTYVVYTPIKV